MMDNSTPILYLSSSMGSIYSNLLGFSYYSSLQPLFEDTSVSTLVDSTSTSHFSPLLDDVYVNLVSHNDDWFHHPLLPTHEIKPHPPYGHYIVIQCLGKGVSNFESLGEAILPNPHSAFGSVVSSVIFLPHFKEPLESHITLY